MIEVRKVLAYEFNLVRSIRTRALTDAPYAFGGTLEKAVNKPIKEYEFDTKRWAESEESTLFIAFNSGEAVGKAGAFFEKESDRAFLCSLWVAPECRKSGIGKKIVSTVTSWLRNRGATTIYAWVANSNHSAIDFYKSIGFKSTNETKRLPSNPNEFETLFEHNVSDDR